MDRNRNLDVVDLLHKLTLIESTKEDYFHITQDVYENKVRWKPRKPYRMMGEPLTPRICVAPTIEGCLVALGEVLVGGRLVYVYKAIGSFKIFNPIKVVDSKVTGEKWIKTPTVFKKIRTLNLEKLLPEDLYINLFGLSAGIADAYVINKQIDTKNRLKPYVSSFSVAEDKEDSEEDLDNIPTYLVPMNFDIRYKKKH